MQSEKKKRGRPRKNPLAETSGMTYGGAINYIMFAVANLYLADRKKLAV